MKEETKRNLNESIIKIRVDLQKSKIKKSGKNKFAGFDYYELSDFLPKLNELMLEEGINDIFTIKDGIAKLILLKGDERQEYEMPFERFATPVNKNGQASMQDIQYLGALNTYYKRYLYLNAFGITDGEVIDGMNNEELETNKKVEKTEDELIATEEKKEKIKELYTTDEIKNYLMNVVKKNKLSDLTLIEASEFIKKKMEEI
mgnify:FL=1